MWYMWLERAKITSMEYDCTQHLVKFIWKEIQKDKNLGNVVKKKHE